MRLFGSERVMAMYQSLNIPEGEEIQHKTITSFIEKAQKKIENNNFGIRKNLLDYDQVNNEQREVIYKERRRVLDGENMRDVIFNMINETVEEIVNRNISEDLEPAEWDMKALNQELVDIFPIEKVELSEEDMSKLQKQDLIQCIKESCTKLYEEKETEFPEPEMIREAERVILLKVIDRKWMDHIDDMDQMRQSIGLRAYGQRDPLVEYKFAGYDMFNDMTASIRQDTVKAMMHLRVEQKVEREEVAKVTGTNKDDTSVKAPVRRKSAKIGRNDPCPCGSGLKYKQCCGKNA
jgi:preprotein translocase subunit SecA